VIITYQLEIPTHTLHTTHYTPHHTPTHYTHTLYIHTAPQQSPSNQHSHQTTDDGHLTTEYKLHTHITYTHITYTHYIHITYTINIHTIHTQHTAAAAAGSSTHTHTHTYTYTHTNLFNMRGECVCHMQRSRGCN
jgi:hypothetical protein